VELQAEYAAAFYTAAYSHPAVDVINYGELGPVTRMPGAGLLDSEGRPRPILHRLRELISEQWSTALEGILPLDGRVQFRGAPGTYELTLKSVSGRDATLEFVVPPASTNTFTFRLDAAGTITKEDASP
jgi:hypothetical protein